MRFHSVLEDKSREGSALGFYRLFELILATQAIVWGLVLAYPGDLFISIELYANSRLFVPDDIWGIVMLILGLGLWMGPGRRKYIKLNRTRRIFHVCLFCVWVSIFVLNMLSGISQVVILIASYPLVLVMLHGLAYIRLSQEDAFLSGRS